MTELFLYLNLIALQFTIVTKYKILSHADNCSFLMKMKFIQFFSFILSEQIDVLLICTEELIFFKNYADYANGV